MEYSVLCATRAATLRPPIPRLRFLLPFFYCPGYLSAEAGVPEKPKRSIERKRPQLGRRRCVSLCQAAPFSFGKPEEIEVVWTERGESAARQAPASSHIFRCGRYQSLSGIFVKPSALPRDIYLSFRCPQCRIKRFFSPVYPVDVFHLSTIKNWPSRGKPAKASDILSVGLPVSHRVLRRLIG